MNGRDVFRFGAFTLEVGERRLSAGSGPIRLSPKALDVLVALVRHPGRLMTKHELLARVWPQSFVEEGIVSVHVAALRKALGDDGRSPSYIETVPRSGYRFVAAVTRESEEESRAPREAARPVALYEHVGRGRVYLLSGSYDALPHAVEAFRAAIAVDSTYAPAHAGLARARCTQAAERSVPHQEAFAEAKASALRALAMDARSADAQVALGTVLFLAEWDWIGAERSLQHALDVDPDHTEALLQYGSLHEALGRLDEGLRLKQQALARDPHSPLVLVNIAHSYWYQRRYDETVAWATRALEIDPKHLLAGMFVAGVYWKAGDIDRFIAQMIRTVTAYGASDEALTSLEEFTARVRQAYAENGFAGWSRFMADEIDFVSDVAFRRAVLYGASGCLDDAFDCLDQAIALRDPAVVHLAVAPELDSLRTDPRFADLLRALSLPSIS